jgi:hypothetical protein
VRDNGGPSAARPVNGPAAGALPAEPAPMPDEIRAQLATLGISVPRRPPPPTLDPEGGDDP